MSHTLPQFPNGTCLLVTRPHNPHPGATKELGVVLHHSPGTLRVQMPNGVILQIPLDPQRVFIRSSHAKGRLPVHEVLSNPGPRLLLYSLEETEFPPAQFAPYVPLSALDPDLPPNFWDRLATVSPFRKGERQSLIPASALMGSCPLTIKELSPLLAQRLTALEDHYIDLNG